MAPEQIQEDIDWVNRTVQGEAAAAGIGAAPGVEVQPPTEAPPTQSRLEAWVETDAKMRKGFRDMLTQNPDKAAAIAMTMLSGGTLGGAAVPLYKARDIYKWLTEPVSGAQVGEPKKINIDVARERMTPPMRAAYDAAKSSPASAQTKKLIAALSPEERQALAALWEEEGKQ